MNPIIKNRFSLFSCLSVISFAHYLFLYVLRVFLYFSNSDTWRQWSKALPLSPPLLLLFAASPQILKVVILRTFNHSRKWRFCPASCYRGSAPSISSPKNSTIIPSFPQFKLIPLLLIPSSLLLKPAERSKAVPRLELRVHFLLQVTEILKISEISFQFSLFF